MLLQNKVYKTFKVTILFAMKKRSLSLEEKETKQSEFESFQHLLNGRQSNQSGNGDRREKVEEMLHLAHFHPHKFVIGGAPTLPENRGNAVFSCHHQKAIGKRREGAISTSVVLPSVFPIHIPRRSPRREKRIAEPENGIFLSWFFNFFTISN